MYKRLRELMGTTFGKYLVVGGSVYVFELLVIVIAQRLKYSDVKAVGASFWLGLIVSFFLQKLFAFKDRRMRGRILIPQILAVCLLVLFNFGFTLLVADLFKHILPPVVSRTIALGLTTIWNFYLYRTRIFVSRMPVHIE